MPCKYTISALAGNSSKCGCYHFISSKHNQFKNSLNVTPFHYAVWPVEDIDQAVALPFRSVAEMEKWTTAPAIADVSTIHR